MERYESPTIEPVGGGGSEALWFYYEENVLAVAEAVGYAVALGAMYAIAAIVVVFVAPGKSQERLRK